MPMKFAMCFYRGRSIMLGKLPIPSTYVPPYGYEYSRRYVSSCTSPTQKTANALSGVRVLDLSRVLAGPYCSQLLGDLGCDVIKVENPIGGDDTREWGGPWVNSQSGNQESNTLESAYFFACNRNKRSMTVNLKSPRGQQIIRDLVKHCDVLVENFGVGKMESYGLSYETLSKINKKLVFASITGFGPTGPRASQPGYDVMAAAFGGLMHITGDKRPAKVGVAVTDLMTGILLANSILASLMVVQKTGCGQRIDGSLFETQVSMLANIGQNYLVSGASGRRLGTAHESIVPYQAFQTTDSYIVAGGMNDRQFASMCKVMDCLDLLEDSRYKTNADRSINRESLIQTLESIMKTKCTQEWLTLFEAERVPCAPVNSISEVFEDPQIQARKMILPLPTHTTLGDGLTTLGFPVKMSSTPSSIRYAPPVLGEHTSQILKEILLMKQAEIDQLIADGVVSTFGSSPQQTG